MIHPPPMSFVPQTKQHRLTEGRVLTTGPWQGRQECVPLGDESHKVTSETMPSVMRGDPEENKAFFPFLRLEKEPGVFQMLV